MNSNDDIEAPQNKKRSYKTSDLYFSTFLLSLDIPLKHTEKEKNERETKVVFVFEISDAVLARSKALYFGGTGTVVARKFVDNMRSLKSLVYV